MGGGKTAQNYAQPWTARGRREKRRRMERGEGSGRKENMCDKAKVEGRKDERETK
jgi:hypothetical protein